MIKNENFLEIEDLGLDCRAYNALRRNGILTIAQVEAFLVNPREIRNFGKKSQEQLKVAIEQYHSKTHTKSPEPISLYMCDNARVTRHPSDDSLKKIYCRKQHDLDGKKTVSFKLEKEGRPLEFSVCQTCPDYLFNGPALDPAERGWNK